MAEDEFVVSHDSRNPVFTKSPLKLAQKKLLLEKIPVTKAAKTMVATLVKLGERPPQLVVIRQLL